MKHGILFAVILAGFIAKQTMAAQHIVGGSQGWDPSTDFDSWASTQTFKVGDQLVFKYTSGLHSVVELSDEDAYKKCDIGSAVDSMSTGNDVVKLTKAGTRYFGCGTMGHCQGGMKVKITVGSGTAPSTPDPSSSSSSSSSSSNKDATSSSCVIKSHNFVLVSALLLVLFNLVYVI